VAAEAAVGAGMSNAAASGKGTRFTLRFPVERQPDTTDMKEADA
jgi:hypothetical protein